MLRFDLPALSTALAHGALTAEALIGECLQRIARDADRLRAVIGIEPSAIDEARALDRERQRTGVRGPLHGVPVLVKDNIETAGALATTAGSLALAHNVTGRDAEVIAKVRTAGAVILGKANLSEWANFRSTLSSSGWSAVGGQTVNAHDPQRTPCGSSSGSAVAVAAGMVPVALGTETDGSIVCPASVNGVVGIKPTVGLVSQRGIVPISFNQDTAGPMATTVSGAALLLDAMTGRREYGASLDLPPRGRAPLVGKRLGVVGGVGRLHPDCQALLDAALDRFRRLGATVVTGLSIHLPNGYRAATLEVLLHEFKHGIDGYLRTVRNPPGLDLEALIRFNREHASEEMPYFGQEVFELAAAKNGLDSEAYRSALTLVRRATREDGIDRLIGGERLDALVGVTSGPAWSIDHVHGDRGAGGCFTYAAVAGYPHVTLPMGRIKGLPIGLSIYGTAFSEQTLIAVAHAFEREEQS